MKGTSTIFIQNLITNVEEPNFCLPFYRHCVGGAERVSQSRASLALISSQALRDEILKHLALALNEATQRAQSNCSHSSNGGGSQLTSFCHTSAMRPVTPGTFSLRFFFSAHNTVSGRVSCNWLSKARLSCGYRNKWFFVKTKLFLQICRLSWNKIGMQVDYLENFIIHQKASLKCLILTSNY